MKPKLPLLKKFGEICKFLSEKGSSISGKCIPQASINKDPYRVEIEVGGDRQLLSGHCNCVSGISGQCKHTSGFNFTKIL